VRVEGLLVRAQLSLARLVVGGDPLELLGALLLLGGELVHLRAAARELADQGVVDLGVERVVFGLDGPSLGSGSGLGRLGALGFRGRLALELGAQAGPEALLEISPGSGCLRLVWRNSAGSCAARD
jgi:hypothetical protein